MENDPHIAKAQKNHADRIAHLKAAANQTEFVHLTRADADVIHRMMVEFFHAKELSPEETAALMNLSSAGDFGRPVPEHGSGP